MRNEGRSAKVTGMLRVNTTGDRDTKAIGKVQRVPYASGRVLFSI